MAVGSGGAAQEMTTHPATRQKADFGVLAAENKSHPRK
jgi:hypothetical protein